MKIDKSRYYQPWRLYHIFSAVVVTGAVACSSTDPSDPDGPPLPAELREALGGRADSSDADQDGLLDDYEIRYGFPNLRPDSADSDGDGIPDADEDEDGDGLTNLEEQALRTGPTDADSDDDELSDGAEVELGTDPRNPDTDQDGMLDGREIINQTDPLTPDSGRITSRRQIETIDPTTGNIQKVGVAITGEGDIAGAVTVGNGSDFTVPGQVGRRFDIAAPNSMNMEAAVVSLPLDANATSVDPEDLAVFTIDPDTGFWQKLPSKVDVSAGTITATTPHFSPFLVANARTFEDSLDDLPDTCDDIDDPDAATVDVVLVIDSSGSMLRNDPTNLRITAAQNFVANMKDTDRVSVVDFDAGASLLTSLTSDQQVAADALGRIDSSGGTDIGAGVQLALQQLEGETTALIQAIILLTDGVGGYSPSLTPQMADAGIRAFTIGLGASVDEALLRSIAEGTQAGFRQLDSASDLVNIFGQFATVFGDDGSDSDGDGLTDCQEIQGVYLTNLGRTVRTSPNNADTDGDGIPDGIEIGDIFEATSLDSAPWSAAGESDPTSADTDGDTVLDPDEFRLATNAFSRDSDGDGLTDGAEVNTYQTDPTNADTDGDRILDGEEVRRASDGLDPAVFDYGTSLRNRLEFMRGLAIGFLAGDFGDIDSVPELVGHIASGVVVIGDVRDFVANVFGGDFISAGLNLVGIAPVLGDAVRSGGIVADFLTRFPWRRAEVIKYVERFFPEGTPLARFLPSLPPRSGAWLLPPFERGRQLESTIAQSIDGIPLLGNFPRIDVWDQATGVATSIKTLDLDARTYQNLSAFRSRVRRYADSMVLPMPVSRVVNGMAIDIDPTQYRLFLGVNREAPQAFLDVVAETAAERGVEIIVRIVQ